MYKYIRECVCDRQTCIWYINLLIYTHVTHILCKHNFYVRCDQSIWSHQFLCVNDLCYNRLTLMYRHDFISFFQTFSVYLSLLNLVSLTHSQRWGLMESRGGAWWWHHRLWGGCLPFPGLRRWPNDKQQQKQPIRALICTMGKARGWSRARGGRGAGVQYEIVCEWKSKWRKVVVMEGNICMSERRMEDSKRIVEKMQWLKSIDGTSRWYKLMRRK